MADATFAIVNLRTGQKRDIDSFLLNNDAFPVLENMYLFRGRIQRRSCTTPVGVDGQLKGIVGTTDGATGALTIGPIVAGTPVGISLTQGYSSFNISTSKLTDPGTAANPVTLLTDGAVTGTLNKTTGVLTTSALGADVTYIPGLPTMGLPLYEQEAINDELLFAFDTRWTYLFDRGTDDFTLENQFRSSGTGDTFVWTGSDSDFFWSTNYFKSFWVTNNVAGYHASENSSPLAEGDGIRWYVDDTTATGWNNFNPPINSGATSFLNGCLCLVPYKGRLLAFNTLEGANLASTTRFAQRVRWSQVGVPYYNNVPNGVTANASAWDSDTPGFGGFLDAPTSEAIVSVEFIKDTLLVYFERSTWQLVYTGNETFPFYFQKINTELGCESTFSKIPFDRGVLAVGNVGITSCDSVNVARIDQNIPDEVFKIQNKNNGSKRVHGIRDYNAQLAYWCYPVLSEYDDDVPTYDLTYPNQLLVYNYLDGSWAQFDDNFTCFGSFQKLNDATWASLERTWESSNFSWNSQVLQSRYPDVIAGNQRGFVSVFSQLQDVGQNMKSLYISDIDAATGTVTCFNHNLVNNDYVLITDATGITGINDGIYLVSNASLNSFILTDNNGSIPTLSGTYTGNGYITHMPNIYVKTKQFNPFYAEGSSLRFTYIDMLLDRTTEGQFTTEFYLSYDSSNINSTSVVSTAPETSYSANQDKIWHRVFTNSFASFVQLVITMNYDQMTDINITTSDIKIGGLVFYVSKAGRLPYEF
jgi:hypothetical protein